MVRCQVLRCRSAGAHVLAIAASNGLRLEPAVCDEHWAQIDRGLAYRWDPGDDAEDLNSGSIVMGTDLEASGVTVTGFLGASTHALVLAQDGTPALSLELETMRSDGSLQTLRLVMSESVADQLASFFQLMLRRPPDD